MGLFNGKKKPSLGEMIAVRLEQREIPATGAEYGDQVFIYESNKKGASAVLSLVKTHPGWGGFWFWHPKSNKELIRFKLPVNSQFDVDDPLSAEIAFLEWIEKNSYFGVTGIFTGEPRSAEQSNLVRTTSDHKYPGRW